MSQVAEVLRRVVVAVDGSESGAAVLQWAAFVARRAGAQMVAASPWSPQQGELLPEEWSAEHAKRLARVRRAVDRVAVGLDHRIEVVDGKATSVLLDQQDLEDADLLVVRLPGHGGSARRLDTTAAALVHRTTRPLAVVPDASRPEIERIVLGVDGSQSSLCAATWCAAFASAVDVEVIATTVLTPELELLSQLEGHTTTAWIHGRLGVDWTSALRDAGVRTDTRVVHEDDLVAGLTDTAEHVDADVIVIGLHARAPLVERRVSETASRLLHRTPVSLLLVP
jgi:nucleotide-binding universal stress UspA family protein